MGHSKVQRKSIEKRSMGKSMHGKIVSGLKKKANGSSKLCDVPAMAIPIDLDGKLDTYPENKEKVGPILKKCYSTRSKGAEECKLSTENMIQSHTLKKQVEKNQLKVDTDNMVNAAVKSLGSVLVEITSMIPMLPYMIDINGDLPELLEVPDVEIGEPVESVDVWMLSGENEGEVVQVWGGCEEDLLNYFQDLE